MGVIIDNKKSEFLDVPDSLNGQILLERHIEGSEVKGWITIPTTLLAAKMKDALPNAVLAPVDQEKTFMEYIVAHPETGYGKHKAVLKSVLDESPGVVAALQSKGLNVEMIKQSINNMTILSD